MTPEMEEKIRLRALEIWKEQGCPDGRAAEHWDQAEREVSKSTSPQPLARARPDPANVLLNPATSPTHELTDTAPAQPNELPPDPDGRHSHDHAEVDHPFGTHSTESSRSGR